MCVSLTIYRKYIDVIFWLRTERRHELKRKNNDSNILNANSLIDKKLQQLISWFNITLRCWYGTLLSRMQIASMRRGCVIWRINKFLCSLHLGIDVMAALIRIVLSRYRSMFLHMFICIWKIREQSKDLFKNIYFMFWCLIKVSSMGQRYCGVR